MKKYFSGSEKAFYSDGYKIGASTINQGFTKQPILEALKQMYQIIDELNYSLAKYAQEQLVTIACKKGCSWCCYQPIYILTHEIVYLQNFIQNNFTKIEVDKIVKKAHEKNQKLVLLGEADLQNSKHPCPLLKNEICTAYKARPMACRIYQSLNLKSCEIFYDEPKNTSNFPQLMDYPLKAGRMMNEGFKAAIKPKGYVSQEFRIEEAIINTFDSSNKQ